VTVIALDTPPEPQDAADALFATDNEKAGELIGSWAKAKFAKDGTEAKVVTIDLAPGVSGRHPAPQRLPEGLRDHRQGGARPRRRRGQPGQGAGAMENLLQKVPDVNLVYTINEPSAFGAYQALKAAGKEKGVTIVSVDGGCEAIEKGIKTGQISATSQQYPQNMAKLGVEAIAKGEKPPATRHRRDADHRRAAGRRRVQGLAYGTENCWG
jgi:fructose transport system substrate-binding protein